MPLERALVTLKKQLLKGGVFKEMKRRAFYEKPSVKRKRKQTEARKKLWKRTKNVREMEARLEKEGR